ncbi:MAG TPA: 16S rRNA (guanine(527)-N(7))-methyltransferase RsmG [Ktedonobacterales bacterium]|jgi:16S rRNA (guanine527-N7)-methyltransferase
MAENEALRTRNQANQAPADLEYLTAGAQRLGLHLTPEQLQQFLRFRVLLLEWNERVNLTAITDPQDILLKHFLDSLTCLLAIPQWQARKEGEQAEKAEREGKAEALQLLDVGSGGGFPGIPLALACPAWEVTLLEATGKKVRFLEEAIRQLELRHVAALQGRAEEVAHDARHRAHYDLVTARGLASLPILLEYCLPFCRPGGLVIAQKKGEISAEIESGKRAAEALGGRLHSAQPIALPGLEDQRVLVVFEATQKTPALYPRRAGAPAKHPLG